MDVFGWVSRLFSASTELRTRDERALRGELDALLGPADASVLERLRALEKSDADPATLVRAARILMQIWPGDDDYNLEAMELLARYGDADVIPDIAERLTRLSTHQARAAAALLATREEPEALYSLLRVLRESESQEAIAAAAHGLAARGMKPTDLDPEAAARFALARADWASLRASARDHAASVLRDTLGERRTFYFGHEASSYRNMALHALHDIGGEAFVQAASAILVDPEETLLTRRLVLDWLRHEYPEPALSLFESLRDDPLIAPWVVAAIVEEANAEADTGGATGWVLKTREHSNWDQQADEMVQYEFHQVFAIELAECALVRVLDAVYDSVAEAEKALQSFREGGGATHLGVLGAAVDAHDGKQWALRLQRVEARGYSSPPDAVLPWSYEVNPRVASMRLGRSANGALSLYDEEGTLMVTCPAGA
jgi:hypothetical protein